MAKEPNAGPDQPILRFGMAVCMVDRMVSPPLFQLKLFPFWNASFNTGSCTSVCQAVHWLTPVIKLYTTAGEAWMVMVCAVCTGACLLMASEAWWELKISNVAMVSAMTITNEMMPDRNFFMMIIIKRD